MTAFQYNVRFQKYNIISDDEILLNSPCAAKLSRLFYHFSYYNTKKGKRINSSNNTKSIELLLFRSTLFNIYLQSEQDEYINNGLQCYTKYDEPYTGICFVI